MTDTAAEPGRISPYLEILAMVVVHHEETQSAIGLGTLQTYARDLLPLRDPEHKSTLTEALAGGRDGRLFPFVLQLAELDLVSVSPQGIIPQVGAWQALGNMEPVDRALVMAFARKVVGTSRHLIARFNVSP